MTAVASLLVIKVTSLIPCGPRPYYPGLLGAFDDDGKLVMTFPRDMPYEEAVSHANHEIVSD